MSPRRRSLLTVSVVAASFGIFTLLERRRPLRKRVAPALPRFVENATIGALALAAAQLVQRPLVAPVMRWSETRRTGVLNVFRLPPLLHDALALVLLDYTLWWWHRLNHETPMLWRFHAVHHRDPDMDASTALRFHAGEHALSAVYRAAQIALIGPSAAALSLWQGILLVSIFFHHANLRLPQAMDDRLAQFVATPRMHGIHHSDVFAHANSNFASILTCWDMLHGTMRLDVPQGLIVIGAPRQPS